MYPYKLFLGLSLYDLFLVLAFFAALAFFRFFADRAAFSGKLQNLCIACALAALVGGYLSAVFFQSLYNYLDGEPFAITATTGATFYGGLIGGAAVFLIAYFEGGYFVLGRGVAQKHFFKLAEIAAPAIALAHGIGRIGCLFAGCCHGRITTAWYGVYNVHLGAKTVPMQLFEAIFLFALAAFLTYRLCKKKSGNLGIYLIIYAVWRFYAEYFRADDRGQTILKNMSPSQLTAIILAVVGIVLWWVISYLEEKSRKGDGSDAT